MKVFEIIILTVCLLPFALTASAGEREDFRAVKSNYIEGNAVELAKLGGMFEKNYPSSESLPDILAMMAHSEEDFDKKTALFARISNEYGGTPQAAEAHMSLGEIYLLRGDYSLAIREFSALSRQYGDAPFYARALFLLATSSLAEGDLLRARINFEKILKVASDRDLKEKARIGVADTYRLGGDHKIALRSYERLLDSKVALENRPRVLLGLAGSHIDSKEMEKGRAFLERLVRESPHSLEAFTASKMLHRMEDDLSNSEPEEGCFLQVGVYSSLEAAEIYKEKLKNLGLEAIILPGDVYKVVIGPFSDDIEAQIYSENLKQEQGIESFVIEE